MHEFVNVDTISEQSPGHISDAHLTRASCASNHQHQVVLFCRQSEVIGSEVPSVPKTCELMAKIRFFSVVCSG